MCFAPHWRNAFHGVSDQRCKLGLVNIFIDESGSFVWHPKRDSWSVVVAVAVPESSRRGLAEAVARLRRSQAFHSAEIKLPQLGESRYVEFLDVLAKIDLVMFATATDSGLNTPGLVGAHRDAQVADVRSNISRMKYEGGRAGMAILAEQLESLPDQLYVQLLCQVNLIYDLIGRGINYYAQRRPATLREFRWRIDQKNTTKTNFEEAFEKLAPALLQTRSIREPFSWVREFDYRHFVSYDFEDGQKPDYLQRDYGFPPMDGFNVQKLFRGNLKFVDSKSLDGVQVADLLASGLRRALKRSFDDPLSVARRLGRLTVQNVRGRQSVNLISLGLEEALPAQSAAIVRCINESSKSFILRNIRPHE